MDSKTDQLVTIPADLSEMITADRPTGRDEGTLGNEGIGRDDILMPRLGLAQKMSPEIDPTNAERYIEGLQFMDLFNSLTKQKYGKGPLHFVILRRDNPRWIEFHPLTEGGGIKDRNVPFGDPRTTFGPDGEKPAATMFYDYIVLLLTGFDPTSPLESIVGLSFKSSGIKTAKNLNLLIQQRGAKLICKGVYELTTGSATDKKTASTYAIYKIRNAGWLKPGSPLETLAIETFEAWRERDVEIDREASDSREPGDDDFNPADLEKTPGM